jgi:hypothetical protein
MVIVTREPSGARGPEVVLVGSMIILPGSAGAAGYVGVGWLSISWPNLVVILVMIVLFVLAIVVPFPRDRDKS